MMRGSVDGTEVFLFDGEHFDTGNGGASHSTEVLFQDAGLPPKTRHRAFASASPTNG